MEKKHATAHTVRHIMIPKRIRKNILEKGNKMKIVVLRSPKAIRYILAKIFNVKLEK